MGSVARVSVVSALLVAVPLLLIILALPRFFGSISLPGVRVILLDRVTGFAVAPIRLVKAQEVLSRVPSGDGENKLWRAELLAVLAGKNPARLEEARIMTIEGLVANPANVRGWTLLCELDVVLRRADAATCLDAAFFIGPFDWSVAQRRTALSVYLWPKVDTDTQDAITRRLRLIWDTPGLRFIDFAVAQSVNGKTMLNVAFASDVAAKAAFDRALASAP